MAKERKVPDDPVAFIKKCLQERRIYWTYHVNMHLAGRHITRDEILEAIDSYEIIESYPDDKYLPGYLLLGKAAGANFHALFAVESKATMSESSRRIVRTRVNGKPT